MTRSDPVRQPKRRRPRDRRQAIVRAAGERFARDGYHGTSMADIAGAVGISSTAVYRHFRNKQDLLGRCFLDGLDTTLDRLARASGSDDSANGVVIELVRVSLELRGLPRLWQLEFRSLAAADRMAVLARVVRLTGFLRTAIVVDRRELGTTDVELLSWCALSVAVSPSYHRVELSGPVFVEVLEDAVAAVVDARLPVAPGRVPTGPRAPIDEGDAEFDRMLRPERMITAAARLFNTQGYAAVGVEDIGRAVGVSGPAVYHHFTSKAELLNEIIERNDQWIRLYTSRALAEGRDARESLHLLLRYFAQFASEQPDLVGTTVSEVGHLPTELSARYRRAHRDGIVRWARLLQAARPELPIAVARVRVQAITTMVIDAVRNPRIAGLPGLVDALVVIGDRIAFADASADPT
ncbi:TetR/AcrR family transcriptional regulator [Nocardia mexicana]|uniref:TetR/AcrR family transcriptional regulator n=1 Tax=Nocardia mexicana TaxID=279262 RepID=UPI001470E6B2|nr:TetR/AcrR family transcriptional regulator [Nocardia mexicana]